MTRPTLPALLDEVKRLRESSKKWEAIARDNRDEANLYMSRGVRAARHLHTALLRASEGEMQSVRCALAVLKGT